jgi:hypothetical protein
VQEALERAAAGRTVLVIAHRLSTVQGSDQVSSTIPLPWRCLSRVEQGCSGAACAPMINGPPINDGPIAHFAAHRQVLVVSGGVIAEQGTHEELLNAGMPRLAEMHTRGYCVLLQQTETLHSALLLDCWSSVACVA